MDAYENRLNAARCIIQLYEKYISHQPSSDKCEPAFYLRLLAKPVSNVSNVWYSCQPKVENDLMKTVGDFALRQELQDTVLIIHYGNQQHHACTIRALISSLSQRPLVTDLMHSGNKSVPMKNTRKQ